MTPLSVACRTTGFPRSALALAAVSLTLSGCAFRTQTTAMAVDYNEFVAGTTNRQTMLNILRAREREPMHFTSFSEVFGQVRGTGSASVGGAFNGDSAAVTATDVVATSTGAGGGLSGVVATGTRTRLDNAGATNLTPSLGLTVTTGTDFRVAANATDEFYKGILNPISASTVVHYLRQGFPADLLSHLVIGRLEFYAVVTPPGGQPEQVLLDTTPNTPDEADAAARFQAAIRCRQLDYETRRTPPRALPVADLAGLAPMAPDIWKRVESKKDPLTGLISYELVTPAQNEFGLLLSVPDATQCGPTRAMLARDMENWAAARGLIPRPPPLTPNGQSGSPKADPGKLRGSVRLTAADETSARSERDVLGRSGEVKFSSSGYFDEKLPVGYSGDLVIDLTLRSVEGVLYYLGEYIRNETISPKLAGDCGYCLPILRIRPIEEVPVATRFADVVYRGKRYAVPLSGATLSAEAGRSSQTIGLVQQLLNLNRSSKDLPSTPLLRVTN